MNSLVAVSIKGVKKCNAAIFGGQRWLDVKFYFKMLRLQSLPSLKLLVWLIKPY